MRFLNHIIHYKAHFTQGIKANVQLKSSIPIGAKVEINPPREGLYTKSQG
jgi:hypothetical protein